MRKIIVNENAGMWRRAWRRKERTTDEPPDRGIVDADMASCVGQHPWGIGPPHRSKALRGTAHTENCPAPTPV